MLVRWQAGKGGRERTDCRERRDYGGDQARNDRGLSGRAALDSTKLGGRSRENAGEGTGKGEDWEDGETHCVMLCWE